MSFINVKTPYIRGKRHKLRIVKDIPSFKRSQSNPYELHESVIFVNFKSIFQYITL